MEGTQRTASSGNGGNGHDDSRCKNQPGGNNSRGKHNRTQASTFRKQQDYRRVITLIDVDNNETVIKRRRRMNGISHERILTLLSHRADRFQNVCNKNDQDKTPHSWAIDETGTIKTSMIEYREAEQQEKEEVFNIKVPEKVLQVHGHVPPKKAEGTIRLIYENINSLCNRMIKNKKLDRTRAIHDDLEVDIVAYCKHQLNRRHRLNHNGVNQLFKGGKAAIQLILAHNTHENFGKTQQ
jgi:hypothetical protein